MTPASLTNTSFLSLFVAGHLSMPKVPPPTSYPNGFNQPKDPYVKQPDLKQPRKPTYKPKPRPPRGPQPRGGCWRGPPGPPSGPPSGPGGGGGGGDTPKDGPDTFGDYNDEPKFFNFRTLVSLATLESAFRMMTHSFSANATTVGLVATAVWLATRRATTKAVEGGFLSALSKVLNLTVRRAIPVLGVLAGVLMGARNAGAVDPMMSFSYKRKALEKKYRTDPNPLVKIEAAMELMMLVAVYQGCADDAADKMLAAMAGKHRASPNDAKIVGAASNAIGAYRKTVAETTKVMTGLRTSILEIMHAIDTTPSMATAQKTVAQHFRPKMGQLTTALDVWVRERGGITANAGTVRGYLAKGAF